MITKYGEILGIEEAEYYQNGNLRSCKITKPFAFKTKAGVFEAQYETRDERRKVTGTIEFYENGDLMSISLDSQIRLKTAAGEIPAEKIIFYEGEKIKRIFPLNGKLSGYWGEENEYGLSEKTSLQFKNNRVSSKFISVAFFESGNIKSLTLWPRERVELDTDKGLINIRKGASFYENGALKSYEPAVQVELDTPIGKIWAFNNEINGLNGDINSIQYFEDGRVKSLYTCNTNIRITENKKVKNINLQMKSGWCNELVKIPCAIKIDFTDELVIFDEKEAFNIKKCRFEINKSGGIKIEEEMAC